MKPWPRDMIGGPAGRTLWHREYPAGGALWIHPGSGALLAAVVICADGVARRVTRIGDHGQPCYSGAWSASVRIRGRTYPGTAYIHGGDAYPASLRFAFAAGKGPPGTGPNGYGTGSRAGRGPGSVEIPPEWRPWVASGADLVAARSPRYDSPFRIVGHLPKGPGGEVNGFTEVHFGPSGVPVAREGTRVWIETETAVVEGIEPAAD